MDNNLPRNEAQRGTNKMFAWGVAIAAIVFIALLVVSILGPEVAVNR